MRTVIWTEQAKLDYWENIDYLQYRWGLNVTLNFMNKVDEVIAILEIGNTAFRPTVYKDTHEVPIVKQISLIYKTDNKNLNLLRFWNNYQDPKKLKL
ncbi:hypothetical protein IWX84_002387 [Flavobacterium sp. CG_9.10]|uniref:type II toxin-antitoxin system RelE/ParE family toxin n=1 Tax=Flavobacterium sp. CG_9.10 TaxID=2787729 RepID=UPI0018CBC53A|nr:type II toxin-antitoxin system RelE/ParE family toxin [Flavobacterium sp. CG_9.10]MBG6111501.1 hypothetical protein [Flavobacterium sp. CG_9.10]